MDLLLSIFPAAIAYTIPLLMGALGGLYSERSGVTNLCIEGLMLMGCFACAASMHAFQGMVPMNINFIIGLVIAVIAGTLFSVLHAVAAINLKADQTISGTAINMIASALTIYLAQTITGSGNITIAHSVVPISVPEILSALFYNILWSAVVVLIAYAVVRLVVRKLPFLAGFRNALAKVFSEKGITAYAVAALVISLVLSLFISSLAVVFVATLVLTAVLAVLAQMKKLPENRLTKRLFAEGKVYASAGAVAVFMLAVLLVALSDGGSFARRMVFSRVFWTTIVCLVIWFGSYLLLYKTSFGLRLRACGEHPSAVASAGVNVHRMRYIGVLASGALAGLGGAVYLITVGGEYNSAAGMNGLGFLAIAGLIFGQWKPFGILGSTFFFGFCYTIANMSRVVPALAVIPPGFLSAFPYVATLIVLVFTSKRNAAPLASGVPY